MMELVQDLFIPFWCSFVPDVSFGNGWFASSDWPANKRERDVIFDPFFKPPEHYMFGTRQAVFSVTRNRFRNRKQLARKGGGGKLLRSRRFLLGPPCANTDFQAAIGSSPFSLEISSAEPRFLNITAHKSGTNLARFAPLNAIV